MKKLLQRFFSVKLQNGGDPYLDVGKDIPIDFTSQASALAFIAAASGRSGS